MADYRTQYSGPEIDEAIGKALNFDTDSIGCLKVESLPNSPYDINTCVKPGSYQADYITNGPVGLGDVSPINFDVYKSSDGSNVVLTQVVKLSSSTATRTSNDAGSNWTDWVISTEPAFLETSGDLSDGVCLQYKVSSSSAVVADKAQFTLKLHAPCGDGSTLSVNGSQNYQIVNSMGNQLSKGDYIAGSYIDLYFSGTASGEDVGKFFAIGSGGMSTSDREDFDEIVDHFKPSENYDTTGEGISWHDIDSASIDGDRVVATRNFSTSKATPRRLVATNATISQVNAMAALNPNMAVLTDAGGLLSTSHGVASKYITALGNLNAAGNMGMILGSSASDGSVTSTGIPTEKLEALKTMGNGPSVIGIDADGNLYDTGVKPDYLTSITALSPNVALITDSSGKVVAGGSSTAITKLTALHGKSSAYSKVMITDGSGDASTSSITSAQLANMVIYDTATRVLVDDLPSTLT